MAGWASSKSCSYGRAVKGLSVLSWGPRSSTALGCLGCLQLLLQGIRNPLVPLQDTSRHINNSKLKRKGKRSCLGGQRRLSGGQVSMGQYSQSSIHTCMKYSYNPGPSMMKTKYMFKKKSRFQVLWPCKWLCAIEQIVYCGFVFFI